MPFTISHAAAVLPLQRFGKLHLPLTALVIGSMAPDFGYFFTQQISRAITHSFTGLFTFALPAGLAAWLFYVLVLEKATITLLNDRWHTRFAHTEAITASLVARAAVAVVLGAFTHLLWDAFTHRATFATDLFPFLLEKTPGLAWLPVYHLLHGVSSVAGFVILWRWARSLHQVPARSLVRPYAIGERARAAALWVIWAATLLGAMWMWFPYARGRYDAQLFYAAVGLMSGFFSAWCAVAIAMWIGARVRARP